MATHLILTNTNMHTETEQRIEEFVHVLHDIAQVALKRGASSTQSKVKIAFSFDRTNRNYYFVVKFNTNIFVNIFYSTQIGVEYVEYVG